MDKSYGYQGRIGRIDLSTGKVEYDLLTSDLARKWLGGGGLNTMLFYESVSHATDPLGAENVIIFGVGPFVGSEIPASGRSTVTTKSPLTNIFADSNAGGTFGVTMKRSGYDHLIIKGKASSPVYIYIKDSKISILPANDLWGMDVFSTNEVLRLRHGPNVDVARIGVAGENLVRFAVIVTSTIRPSVFGRTGVGAVMGSKMLKAIVVDGSYKTEIFDEPTVHQMAKYLRNKMTDSLSCQDRAKNGTLNVITGYIASNELWKENHRTLATEKEGESLDPNVFLRKYQKGKSGCYRCPLACTLSWVIPEGKFAGESGNKVEFGHTFPLGVNLGLFDFASVLHLANLTNKLGIDSVECGYVLSMASECFEKGIIDRTLCDNVDIHWGNAVAYEQLINKIAVRDGIGNLLAEGTKRAADIIGGEASQYALHIKGLGYGIEESAGWTLGLLTSSRGGDHLKAMPISLYAFGMPPMIDYILGKPPGDHSVYDMHSAAGKGELIWWHENYKAFLDALGLCVFPYLMMIMGSGECLPSELNVLFGAVTGIDMKDREFGACAERIYQLQRLFNAKSGLRRDDDLFTPRPVDTIHREKSPYTKASIDWNGMLDDYYRFRGCTNEGLPTYERLYSVGLERYIEEADDMGVLRALN